MPSFADRLEQLVAAGDDGPDRLAVRHLGDRRPWCLGPIARRVEDVVGLGVGPQQGLDAAPQPLVAGAGLRQEGGALGLGRLLQGGDEDRGLGHDPGPSRRRTVGRPVIQCAISRRKAPRSRIFFFRDLRAEPGPRIGPPAVRGRR